MKKKLDLRENLGFIRLRLKRAVFTAGEARIRKDILKRLALAYAEISKIEKEYEAYLQPSLKEIGKRRD